MIQQPMDVLSRHPIRKSKKQKQDFRADVEAYVTTLGYEYRAETGSFGARNLVIGDPEKAKVLITAHYDTCAALPFPNLITPCNFLPFLGYQLLVAAFLILVPMIPGVLIGVMAKNFDLGYWIWLILCVTLMALLFVGPANKSNANDNTSGVVTLLEIARTLPENLRGRTCFVLFDLEEAGLLGSASYRKAHKKETDRQTVLNLDCVGDGDHIRFFPTKKLKKDKKRLSALCKACGCFGEKDIQIREKGFSFYPSDQVNFPYGMGICALRQSKLGLYLGRIHTKRDTILEQTNVNLLRAALTTYITRGEGI